MRNRLSGEEQQIRRSGAAHRLKSHVSGALPEFYLFSATPSFGMLPPPCAPGSRVGGSL